MPPGANRPHVTFGIAVYRRVVSGITYGVELWLTCRLQPPVAGTLDTGDKIVRPDRYATMLFWGQMKTKIKARTLKFHAFFAA